MVKDADGLGYSISKPMNRIVLMIDRSRTKITFY